MIIVDIEASGADVTKHSIVSIGAVDFDDPTNRFYGECRIDPDSGFTDEALAVNGFTQAQIADPQKQSVAELVTAYFEWSKDITDKTIAGQNVTFDRDFINAACQRHQLNYEIGRRVVDMHALAYARHLQLYRTIPQTDGYSHLNTDTILVFVGLQERPGAHNGLEDALLEAEVFSRIMFGKNLLPEFEQFAVPDYLKIESAQ